MSRWGGELRRRASNPRSAARVHRCHCCPSVLWRRRAVPTADRPGRDGFVRAAGAALGAFWVPAIINPLKSRAIDRYGLPRVLTPLGCAYTAVLLAMAGIVQLGVSASIPYVVLAGAAGLVAPPVGPVMGGIWASLTPDPAARARAYHLDAVVEKTLFAIGSVLVGGLMALSTSAAALVVTAVLAMLGARGHIALGAAQTWPSRMSLAVNISTRELTGRNLRRRVEHALLQHDFDPVRLILEITESSILRAGPAALVELEKLRQSGVRVAIDDFGTAYATLQNLTILPVDALKVDTSFTAGLPHRRTHTAIVHGIASMAFELDIPCIIEGVETETQLAAIQGMSVHAQGWLWGKPQGPEYIPTLHPMPLPPAHPDITRSAIGPAR